MTKFALFTLIWIALASQPVLAQSPTPPGTAAFDNAVPFEELHRLIRQHLAGSSDEELNTAAVKGLIEQLKPHVLLGGPSTASDSTNALVMKAERYRGEFGYLRVGAVREGLAGALRQSIDRLLESGPLKGLVLDLRAAAGTNYAAAAQTAGLFTDATGKLLQVGEAGFQADSSGDDILIPVMTLTNSDTAGAAEALAAVLRSLKTGLIIGARTAGQATIYEAFTLSNGQAIHIASKPVQLGDGSAIPRTGLVPDLPIATSAEDERQYLTDPFWDPNPSGTNRAAAPRRRITEADLVRQRREGISLQQIITNATDTASGTMPALRDPALVRALDMLKALTVVQSWKKEPRATELE